MRKSKRDFLVRDIVVRGKAISILYDKISHDTKIAAATHASHKVWRVVDPTITQVKEEFGCPRS